MESVIKVNDENQLQTELTNAATKIVVANFTATWCRPCKLLTPVFKEFATKYPRAIFLEIDADKCQETVKAEEITVLPTTLFYREKTIIDRFIGADGAKLETKIQEYCGPPEESEESEGVATSGEEKAEA